MPWQVDDNSPRAIAELLRSRGLALKKRWGQNFMISPASRQRVVDELAIRSTDSVWEIGPGLGAITELIVGRSAQTTLFEIDWGLIDLLTERFGSRVHIVSGDAVETIPQTVLGRERPPDLVVGNLPYHSASAIVMTLLETRSGLENVRRMVFTVQREVARRMAAKAGERDYSPFSVATQLAAGVRIAGELGKGGFYPQPEVLSSLVVLTPHRERDQLRYVASRVARALFTTRRKTIANNARYAMDALGIPDLVFRAALNAASIPESSRAEVVPPSGYLGIASALVELDPQIGDR